MAAGAHAVSLGQRSCRALVPGPFCVAPFGFLPSKVRSAYSGRLARDESLAARGTLDSRGVDPQKLGWRDAVAALRADRVETRPNCLQIDLRLARHSILDGTIHFRWPIMGDR